MQEYKSESVIIVLPSWSFQEDPDLIHSKCKKHFEYVLLAQPELENS